MPKRSLYACKRAAFTLLVPFSLLVAGVPGAGAQPQSPSPCTSCIVLIAAPGQTLLVSTPLNQLEILIRTQGADRASLGAALAAVRSAGGRPGLWIAGLDGIPDAEVLALSHRVVVDLGLEESDIDALAFRLKTRLVEMRGANPALTIGISTDRRTLADLEPRDIGAYIDFHATPAVSRPAFPGSAAALGQWYALDQGDSASRDHSSDGLSAGWLPSDALAAQRIISDVARTAPLLNQGLIAGGLADVRCGSEPIPTYLDPETLSTVAITTCPGGSIVVTPPAPGTERLAVSSGEQVIRVPAAAGRFAEGVEVVSARKLTVREIIARHQAAAARQRREVRHVISTGTMTLTFEAPGFPAPMAITTQAVIFTAPDRTEIEQREVRVNGIAFQGSNIPRLPLLEPERVAAPPLAIALTDVYRYSLHGEDEAGGVRCHVIGFDPIDRRRNLFAGRAWIAMDSFAMVKVSAVQTGLRGPIVSSEQTDSFLPQGSAWLLARSEVRQIYEGAGHRTPIHRVLDVARHEVNPPSFETRRQAAYASPSIILRDTPEGFRYLQRRPAGPAGSVTNVEALVTGPAQRVRTVAVGVIVDPNISRPLPFAGLSYVDFNLFGTGTQLNGFFGGTYGQVAVAVPSLGGTRWQAGGRAFGIVSSYNDRAFVDGRERYPANVAQRPAHASAWLLRPLTPRITVRAGYDFDYTHYARSDSTAGSFTVPAAQAAHALRVGVEGQWAGWSASLWWSGARRAGWRQWGETAPSGVETVPGINDYSSRHRDYQRVGALVARSFVATPRLVGRVEAAWMTGRDLDRFSRYAFGSFDNRLRGYPSALIRYDRGGVIRAAVAWAAGRLLRIDGFLDTAHVRDPGFGSSAKSYTGIGAAAEVPAPFGTLVAVEWGYGFQGIETNGGRGTQVLRISGYKMF
jgi:hypothetical protein